jgi:DNA-binding CsgD family transcriptional regulator
MMDEYGERIASVRLRTVRPDAGLIVVADRIDPLYGKLLLAARVSCIPLRASAEEIRETAHIAAGGSCVFRTNDGQRIQGRGGGLTQRELQVLKLICSGYTPGEIALKLQISVETARTHTRNARVKLELPSKRVLTGLSLPALLRAA